MNAPTTPPPPGIRSHADLRAAIHTALTTTPAKRARIADNAEVNPFAEHGKGHNYAAHCALCRGEADTLTDAVMAVLDQAFTPTLRLDPPPELSAQEIAAWQAAWSEALAGDTQPRRAVFLHAGRHATRTAADDELEQLTARLDALRALPERLRVMAAAAGPNPDARRAALREAALLIDKALADTAPNPLADPENEG